MKLTVRNHYNPCFWTAHWNPTYFDRARKGDRNKTDARQQRVFVLNIKSNKIYSTSVENTHFDKHLGVAEITPEAAKCFCKRNFPDEYDRVCKHLETHPETLYLDFENILSGLENSSSPILLRTIQRGRVDSLRERGELAAFVATHHLRSHAMMNSMVELNERAGIPKFEYFWMLKHFLSNTEQLFQYTIALTMGRWRFYKLDEDTFPLTDTPVLVQPGSVMIALSPRLLLEIDRRDRSADSSWICISYIAPAKLEEFRRRTVGNTFREIIFGDKKVLEDWQHTPEFAKRHRLMVDTATYNVKVMEHLNGEVWQINAHGNMLP